MVDSPTLTKKFQKELNAGIASLVLLSVMDNSDEPMYGYQIAKLLDDYSGETSFMKQGAYIPSFVSWKAVVYWKAKWNHRSQVRRADIMRSQRKVKRRWSSGRAYGNK